MPCNPWVDNASLRCPAHRSSCDGSAACPSIRGNALSQDSISIKQHVVKLDRGVSWNRSPAFAPHTHRCRGLFITRAQQQQTQEKQNTTPDFAEDEIIFKPMQEARAV